MFCENVVTLVGWICKNYSTFGLFNMYYSSFFFSQSSICTLFSTVFLHCVRTIAATVLWFRESFLFFFSFFSSFSVIGLCFFFFFNIDVSLHLYCYTDTTNFTIFSQLLMCQFLTSRNKIIKYEFVANHNWK